MKNITLGKNLKILLTGFKKVGKTHLLNLFNNIRKEENDEYIPSDFDLVYNIEYNYNNIEYQLFVTDSIGTTKNEIDLDFLIQENQKFIILFSYENIESLLIIKDILDRINFVKGDLKNNILIMGNDFSDNIENNQEFEDFLNNELNDFEFIKIKKLNKEMSIEVFEKLMNMDYENRINEEINKDLIKRKSYFFCY